MACLSAELKAKYQADLTKVQNQLSIVETTINNALTNGEVEEYKFSDSEGSQQTIRRSLKELYDIQSKLEAQEAKLLRKLNSTGLVNLNLRRKSYSPYGRR